MRLLFAPIEGRGVCTPDETAPKAQLRPPAAPPPRSAPDGYEPYLGRSVEDVLSGLHPAPAPARSLTRVAAICLVILLAGAGLLLWMGYYLIKEPPALTAEEAAEAAAVEAEAPPAPEAPRRLPLASARLQRSKQQRLAARLLSWKPSTPAADEVASAREPAEPTSRLFKAMPVSPLRGAHLADSQLDTLDLAAPPVDEAPDRERERDVEVARPAEPGRIPRLGGIFRTAAGPAAILDGQPVGLGERIGMYRVEQMEADRVVLSYKDRWIELALPER